MSYRIEKINSLTDLQAQRMFSWLKDPVNKFYGSVCSGPNDPPPYMDWKDLQIQSDKPETYRYGIILDEQFVGEFNFVFNHPALLKTSTKSAWIGIGIGEESARGKGLGTMAMNFIEQEVKKYGGERIELGVFEFNHPAIALYEKLGYRRFDTIKNFTWFNGRMWSDFRYEKIF